MILKKAFKYATTIIMLIIIASIPLFVSDYEEIVKLTREDGFLEYMQALFFLLSACILLFLFIRSKREGEKYFLNTNRNYFFFFLFLLFFLFFGEEISWGQRLIGIKTPEFLRKINAQGEFNIHNLWIFQSYDTTLVHKTGLQSYITSPRLFAYFWFLSFFIIPVLNYLSSAIHRFFKRIHLPIVPLWIGFLFMLSYFIMKIIEKIWIINDLRPVSEIKETSAAFLVFSASLSLYLIYRKKIDQTIPGVSDSVKT